RSLLSNYRGQSRTGDRWITSQLDLRKSPGCVLAGYHHVADHGQFGSASQTIATHCCYRYLLHRSKLADHAMNLAQHGFSFIAGVRRHIHAGGEIRARAGKHDDRNIVSFGNFAQYPGQFIHHGKVDDVLIAMCERDPSCRSGYVEIDSHLEFADCRSDRPITRWADHPILSRPEALSIVLADGAEFSLGRYRCLLHFITHAQLPTSRT